MLIATVIHWARECSLLRLSPTIGCGWPSVFGIIIIIIVLYDYYNYFGISFLLLLF